MRKNMKGKRENNDGGGGGPDNKRNRRDNNQDDPQAVRLLIPSTIAGAVIGKGGQHIQRMRTQYKATVSVDDSQGPERTILIATDLDSTLQIITEMIKYFEELPDEEYDVRLLIHQSLAGCIIGKGGQKIKEIRDKIGCRILKVFSNVAPQSTDRVVQTVGKQDQVLNAVRDVITLARETPIKGAIHNYEPRNFDRMFSDEYGGYGNVVGQNNNQRQSRGNNRGGGGGGGGGYGNNGGGGGGHGGGGNRGNNNGNDRNRNDRSRSNGRRDNNNPFVNPWANNNNNNNNGGGFSGNNGGGGGGGGFPGNFGGGFGSNFGGNNFGNLPVGNNFSNPPGFNQGGGNGGFGGGASNNQGGGVGGFPNQGGNLGGGGGGGVVPALNFGGGMNAPGNGVNFGGPNNNNLGNGAGNTGSLPAFGGGVDGTNNNNNTNNNNSNNNSNNGGNTNLPNGHDPKNNTQQVTIPKDLAGAIIGKGGGRIRRIRNDSGAYITIDEPLAGSTDRIITISGSPRQIQMAQYLLQQSVHESNGGGGGGGGGGNRRNF